MLPSRNGDCRAIVAGSWVDCRTQQRALTRMQHGLPSLLPAQREVQAGAGAGIDTHRVACLAAKLRALRRHGLKLLQGSTCPGDGEKERAIEEEQERVATARRSELTSGRTSSTLLAPFRN